MTLTQARQHIGAQVLYRPPCTPGDPIPNNEEGVIESVNERYVFVRYSRDQHSKATYPGYLLLVEDGGDSE